MLSFAIPGDPKEAVDPSGSQVGSPLGPLWLDPWHRDWA